MRPIRRIVVGLDLGPRDPEVWEAACAVARLLDAELHLVHAVEPRAPGFDLVARGAEGRFHELWAARDPAVRVAPACTIEAGDPATTILEAARLLEADLIVVGAVEDGAARCAEQVVRDAAAPVWAVRPGQPPRPRRVVAVVDADRPAREVLDAAGRVARTASARLDLVALTSRVTALEVAQARLAEALAGSEADALAPALQVLPGQPSADALVELARREGADLLVLGEPRPRGLRRLFDGSQVADGLRRFPCSVLRVRTPD